MQMLDQGARKGTKVAHFTAHYLSGPSAFIRDSAFYIDHLDSNCCGFHSDGWTKLGAIAEEQQMRRLRAVFRLRRTIQIGQRKLQHSHLMVRTKVFYRLNPTFNSPPSDSQIFYV